MSTSSTENGSGVFSRFIRYLINDRKARAWAVGIISILVIQLVEQSLIQDVMVAFLGVTITFIVLPEMNYDIKDSVNEAMGWVSSPESLVTMLGPDRSLETLSKLSSEILHQFNGELPGLKSDDPFTRGYAPIKNLWKDPSQYVHDLNYEIVLTRRVYGAQNQIDALECIATTRSRRVPDWSGKNDVWISFCRTPEAFRTEFSFQNCLGRNLVSFTPEYWTELVVNPEKNFSASIEVRNENKDESILVTTFRYELIGEVLRLHLDGMPNVQNERMFIREEYRYPFSPQQQHFGATFNTYFCTGTTHVGLSISDQTVTSLRVLPFFSVGERPNSGGRKSEPMTNQTGDRWRAEITVNSALVWPGSGACFIWERNSHV